MLDMGFIHDVRNDHRRAAEGSARRCSSRRPCRPRSAALAASILKDPVAGRGDAVASTTVEQHRPARLLRRLPRNKRALLAEILQGPGDHPRPRLHPHQARRQPRRRAAGPQRRSQADAIHGNKSQAARQRALEDFRAGRRARARRDRHRRPRHRHRRHQPRHQLRPAERARELRPPHRPHRARRRRRASRSPSATATERAYLARHREADAPCDRGRGGPSLPCPPPSECGARGARAACRAWTPRRARAPRRARTARGDGRTGSPRPRQTVLAKAGLRPAAAQGLGAQHREDT